MFFYLSKLFWIAAAPSNLLVVFCVLIVFSTARRSGRPKLSSAVALGLLFASFSPLGILLAVPLEARFPQPDLTGVRPAGIIVLGGPIDPTLGAAHGTVHLLNGAERLTTAVELSRRYPRIPIVYTGGTNAIILHESSEASDAKRLLISLGVQPDRILLEDRSRNTAENAENTRALLPTSGRRYLLVTSAYHMPRSVGLFRKAGFALIPYPVDYRTTGSIKDWLPMGMASQGLGNLDFSIREWIGLIAYFAAGKTDTLFPGPGDAAHPG